MLRLVLDPPLLLSLGLGMALVLAGNLLARRRLGRIRGAFTVFGLTLLVYLPYAATRWAGGDVFAIHLAFLLTPSLVFGLVDRGPVDAQRAPRLFIAGIGGFAALVLLVNVIMVAVSDGGLSGRIAAVALPEPLGGGQVSSRFPGTVTPDAGHRQALYQHHLRQLETQAGLGWEIREGWLQSPQVGRPATFQVSLGSSDGRPLRGARMAGIFLRPSDPALDQSFVMSEPSPGLYQVELRLPAPGLWNLLLRIERSGSRYELRGSTSVGSAADSGAALAAPHG